MDAKLLSFGSIEIDGQRFDHDVVIDSDGVRRRKKGPSKAYRQQFGHTPLSLDEAIPWSARRLLIGTGVSGQLPVLPAGVRRGAATRRGSRGATDVRGLRAPSRGRWRRGRRPPRHLLTDRRKACPSRRASPRWVVGRNRLLALFAVCRELRLPSPSGCDSCRLENRNRLRLLLGPSGPHKARAGQDECPADHPEQDGQSEAELQGCGR